MAKKSQKNTTTISPLSTDDCVFDRKLARRDAKQLGLSKADLPNSIKEIISTLNEAGFEAYIVGGGVRDALLGLTPKDFDAVTNATPNQIKEIFGKRCRIIGRRFLLCHVYSGRDMIEVATFRAPPKDDNHLTEDGMIMRDNVWGDIFQDVVRRDFSINALYYQPIEGFVYDFCGGLADIKERKLRLLGDTKKRIEEDPVRLLRALRFKAKLNFNFDDDLAQQFNPTNWGLLSQVSPHRLYDETQKMFTGGYLTPLLPLLFDYAAFKHLLFYPPTLISPLLEQVTQNTDKRISTGKSINPAFFYAALLWENYLYLLDKFKKNSPFAEAQTQAANKVMDKQRTHTAMPKFAEQFIKDIWLMQPRLAEPRKKNLLKLFENPRFRAGFDFLMLREQVEAKNHALQSEYGQAITLDNESTNGMGHWWAWFQTLNSKQQQQAINEFDIEAVRLRFANIVRQASQSIDTPLVNSRLHHQAVDTADTEQASNSRERRRNGKKPKANYLTEQQQQEKDQLQLLSLSQGSESSVPAQPLWGTPFNHQVAATEVIASTTTTVESNQVATQAPVLQATITDLENPIEIEAPVRQRRKKLNKRNDGQSGSIPAKRARRKPSSELSIAEQRALMAEHNDVKNSTSQSLKEAEAMSSTDIPTHQAIKSSKAHTASSTQSVSTRQPRQTRSNSARQVDKASQTSSMEGISDVAASGDLPQQVPSNQPVLLPITNNETPIPKKRRRKAIPSDQSSPVTEPMNQANESSQPIASDSIPNPITKPPATRRRRAPKTTNE